MNHQKDQVFEAELRRLKPSKAPETLVSRLRAARPTQPEPRLSACRDKPGWRLFAGSFGLARWLVPTGCAAVVLIAAVLAWPHLRSGSKTAGKTSSPVATGSGHATMAKNQGTAGPVVPASALDVVNADNVEIDRNLLASFEAVAEMPDGVPVRFSCREWEERVKFKDSRRGLIVERSVPQFEVVPVKFETY